MTTVALPATLERLMHYLHACGGSDRFEFFDPSGDPDPLRARDFAEELREQFTSHLGHDLEVLQSANRVTVRLV
jgi:hypothetical protein